MGATSEPPPLAAWEVFMVKKYNVTPLVAAAMPR